MTSEEEARKAREYTTRLSKGDDWVVWTTSSRGGTVDFALLTDVEPSKYGARGWVAGPLRDKIKCISVSDLIRDGHVSSRSYQVMSPRYWKEDEQRLRRELSTQKFIVWGDDWDDAPEARWRVCLGLPATGKLMPEEIRRAFRLKAQSVHPDKGGDAAAYQAIASARDALLQRAAR
jgi:hypothetical protein